MKPKTLRWVLAERKVVKSEVKQKDKTGGGLLWATSLRLRMGEKGKPLAKGKEARGDPSHTMCAP